MNYKYLRRKDRRGTIHAAAISTQPKPPRCRSLMARGIRFQAWLCRVCGFFFIWGVFGGDFKSQPKVVWKSWYTLYSCCCLAFLLWVDIAAFITKADELDGGGNQLNNVLKIIMHIILFIRTILTLQCLTLRSPKLLAFYMRAADFEKHIGMKRCSLSGSSRFFWRDIRQAVYCVLYCLGFLLTIPDPPPYRPASRAGFSETKEAYFWSRLFVLTFFYFVFDGTCAAMMTRSCQSLKEYTENQLNVLKAHVSVRYPGLYHNVHTARHIQEVRRNLSTVRRLKDEINDIWCWPLVFTTACVITVLCWAVYDIGEHGIAGVSVEKHSSIILYACCVIYDFTVLASASQSLANTTKKIKDVCKAVRHTEDPHFRLQVKLLRDWIVPEDMFLRGGHFFSVNMSLLVQMAASVISYSVILLQTDQSIGISRNDTSRGFFSVGN